MRKSLALAVFVAGAMHGQLASALGVGDIATASTLNQPFKAFIPLRDAKGLEAAQLRVELADQQAFKNAGIDRTQFLNSLEFLVDSTMREKQNKRPRDDKRHPRKVSTSKQKKRKKPKIKK